MKKTEMLLVGLIVGTMMAAPIFAQQGQGGSDGRRGPGGKGPFTIIDTDGDDQISEQEWVVHQSERFAEIDTDGDGYVSEDEMKTHHQTMMRQGPPGGGQNSRSGN
jgi:hypothetical protein